jgi:hypothetical protein
VGIYKVFFFVNILSVMFDLTVGSEERHAYAGTTRYTNRRLPALNAFKIQRCFEFQR